MHVHMAFGLDEFLFNWDNMYEQVLIIDHADVIAMQVSYKTIL